MSLKSIYSILDSYQFPLVASSVQCLCDCPGGSSQCDSQTNMCGNTTNCATYFNPSVRSDGCFFKFLQLSAAMCCSIKVSQLSQKQYVNGDGVGYNLWNDPYQSDAYKHRSFEAQPSQTAAWGSHLGLVTKPGW